MHSMYETWNFMPTSSRNLSPQYMTQFRRAEWKAPLFKREGFFSLSSFFVHGSSVEDFAKKWSSVVRVISKVADIIIRRRCIHIWLTTFWLSSCCPSFNQTSVFPCNFLQLWSSVGPIHHYHHPIFKIQVNRIKKNLYIGLILWGDKDFKMAPWTIFIMVIFLTGHAKGKDECFQPNFTTHKWQTTFCLQNCKSYEEWRFRP